MRCLLTALILFTHFISSAQKVIDVNKTDNLGANTFFSVGGEPFVNAKFVRLTSGTPYFVDKWLKAKGYTESGIAYSTTAVKLNLLDNQILFLDQKGNEMIASIALSHLVLLDTVSGHEYYFIHSSLFPKATAAKSGWYQLLTTGNASLYQFHQKELKEERPYGSATTEQSIVTRPQFFIYSNEKLHKIKKSKDVLAVFPDKEKELEEQLNAKNFQQQTIAEQLVLLVNHCNGF